MHICQNTETNSKIIRGAIILFIHIQWGGIKFLNIEAFVFQNRSAFNISDEQKRQSVRTPVSELRPERSLDSEV